MCLSGLSIVKTKGVIRSMKSFLITLLTLAASTLALEVQADQPVTVGDYTVHFNAFNTDSLQPSMAKAYNIVRSKNRGMFTVSVMKKANELSPMGTAVRATLTASGSNLTGQLREFPVREIDEGTAIYYISVFHVAHGETLDFDLQVLPEGETKPFTVEFRQQFYTQ